MIGHNTFITCIIGPLLFLLCVGLVAFGERLFARAKTLAIVTAIIGALSGFTLGAGDAPAPRRRLREKFLRFDDALAAKGVPPLTQWWRDGIGDWLDAYEDGKVTELFACVGRGAAKSTALYKLCLFFAVFTAVAVPPGERHWAIVLSRLVAEASKGISIIAAWLKLLGIGHKLVGDVIELTDTPRGIRVVAASVAATSGWRAFFVGKDERSKLPMDGTTELDAEEIDTSAAAMTATHPLAPIVSFGSAWGAFGGFFDAISGGSTPYRVVLGPTPTWIAAPHISREDCERKERDPRRFAREFMCVFSSGGAATFDADEVDRGICEIGDNYEEVGQPLFLTDSSAGRLDNWSWCRATWCRKFIEEEERWLWTSAYDARGNLSVKYGALKRDAAGEPISNPDYVASKNFLRIDMMGALSGKFAIDVDADDVVENLCAKADEGGADKIAGDGYQAYFLTSGCARRRKAYLPLTWTSETKAVAVGRARQLFRDGLIKIEPCDEAQRLRRELLQFQEKILPSGLLSYGARRGGHDDRVALILNACMADTQGLLAGSPIRGGRGRIDLSPGDFESAY